MKSLRLAAAVLLTFAGLAAAETEQPPFEVKDRAVSENMRQIYYALDRLLKDPETLRVLQSLRVGIGPVENVTATATSGGSLAAQTWYWKVYPMGIDGKLGTPSRMVSATTSGANLSALLTWDQLPNVDHYRVSRHSAKHGPDGYFIVPASATSFTDSGGTLITSPSQNPWVGQIGSTVTAFGGAISVPASSAGLYFVDYVTGELSGYIGGTSAGELVIKAGAEGTWAGTVILADNADRQMIAVQRWPTPGVSSSNVRMAVFKDAVTYAPTFHVVAGSSIVFNMNASEDEFSFTSSAIEFLNGNQAAFLSNDNTAAGSIRNPTTNTRALRLATNVTAVDIVADGTVEVAKGAKPDGGGLKHKRVTTGSVSGSGTATVVVAWDTAFADTNYTLTAGVTDTDLEVNGYNVITATGCEVSVRNNSGSPQTGTLHLIAVHD